MKRALLVGSGFSAQLIPEYSVKNVEEAINREIKDIYYKLLYLFSGFNGCKGNKDKIIQKLQEIGFPDAEKKYMDFFETHNLNSYIDVKNISMIETLLKISKLFQIIDKSTKEEYNLIQKFASTFYWNNGRNDINGIKRKDFNIEKFKLFLNNYQYIFTTNYDTILDSTYDGEIFHLHGSFLIDKCGCKTKVNSTDSLIIWGIDHVEKMGAVDESIACHKYNGGLKYNSHDEYNRRSILDTYYKNLYTKDFSEIDIVGYSGENDRHINEKIIQNPILKIINFYCSPNEVTNDILKQKISTLFQNKIPVNLVSWEEFWNKFIEE